MKKYLLFAALMAAASLKAEEDVRPEVSDASFPAESAANSALPTLWIIGDSTVKNNGSMRGWGQEVGAYFDPAKINVVNRAIGGRSSRTFINEGRWDAVLREMRAGDFLLVQFGHNDVGPLDEKGKFRGSLKGAGEETKDIVKSDGSIETVHSFGWYMRKYGIDAKAKGVTVIYCSPVPHKTWKEGKIARNTTYATWTAAAAKATGESFVDLNEIAARRYEEAGPEKVEVLFADRRTHTSAEGARTNARAMIAGLNALPDCPLREKLSSQGLAVPAAGLAKP